MLLSVVVLWLEEVVVVGLDSMKLFLSRASLKTFASWVFLSLLALFSLSLPSFSAEQVALLVAEVVALDQAVISLETGTCNIGLGRYEGNFANQHILILRRFLSFYILSLDVTFGRTPASPLAL